MVPSSLLTTSHQNMPRAARTDTGVQEAETLRAETSRPQVETSQEAESGSGVEVERIAHAKLPSSQAHWSKLMLCEIPT